MNRPTHFEFSAADPERAAEFYGSVFGWRFTKWSGPMEYWLIDTGSKHEPGINGGMTRRSPHSPPGTTNSIDVASVDEIERAVVARGGKIALPKMAIPGVGWLLYFQDPDGNLMGAMQADPGAK